MELIFVILLRPETLEGLSQLAMQISKATEGLQRTVKYLPPQGTLLYPLFVSCLISVLSNLDDESKLVANKDQKKQLTDNLNVVSDITYDASILVRIEFMA